jgi:hypothetical protein
MRVRPEGFRPFEGLLPKDNCSGVRKHAVCPENEWRRRFHAPIRVWIQADGLL